MDKRSFFRGFGSGVLFAAAVLGISFAVRTSDAYITSRAKDLGMVFQEQGEEALFAKATPAKDAEEKGSEEKKQQKTSESPQNTKKPDAKASAKPSAKPEKTEKPKESAAPKTTPKPESTPAKIVPKYLASIQLR